MNEEGDEVFSAPLYKLAGQQRRPTRIYCEYLSDNALCRYFYGISAVILLLYRFMLLMQVYVFITR